MSGIPDFKSHPLLLGGQMQTIGGYFLSPSIKLAADDTLWVTVDDEDQIALDINFPSEDSGVSSHKGVVLLMHGLGGCSESTYILRLAKKLLAEGWITARLNHRGCGRHQQMVKGLYHSGSTHDVLKAIEFLSQRWVNGPVIPIGFSLSGTILLNLLGMEPSSCEEIKNWPLSIAVCSPIDLEISSKHLTSRWNWHYNRFFSFLLMNHAKTRYPEIYQEVFANGKRPIWDLRMFDEQVTAPYSGFKDREDYYRRCSPRFYVSRIQKPTYLLGASDDPLVPGYTMQSAPISSQVELCLQASGGHMGFISDTKTRFGDNRWLDDVLMTLCDRMTWKIAS